MWRRYGDVTFAVVFAVAVSIEALPLGLLTWTLAARVGSSSDGARLGSILLGAVGSSAAALILLTTYVLAYQHVSTRHDRVRAERRRTWVARWLRVLDGSEATPAGTLRPEAVEALLALRETLRGSDSTRVADLLERYGAVVHLERIAGHGRTNRRLDAIVALSNARIASSLPTLVEGVADSNRIICVASARAAARTLARLEDLFDRDRGAAALARAMDDAQLPYGIVEEVVVLAEDAATSLIQSLLLQDRPRAGTIRAAIDGIGRLQLLVFAEEVMRFLRDPDDEVRAAALRAVGRLGFLPADSQSAVITALTDDVDFIRIHAAAAARFLPRPQALSLLSERLGDRSWWVRRAAADALVALGPAGLAQLGRAARAHPDGFARDIAEQALRDHVPNLVQAVVG
ncbi:MAG: HEAT repeat domain-containing protein [Actinomycetota bacterium]